MINFWDFDAWGIINVFAVLLLSLLAANALKRTVGFLKKSLVPTSVLGGIILLIVSTVYQSVSGKIMFDTSFFGGSGMSLLETLTYHCLALGFIASTMRDSGAKFGKKRSVEIFNTGVTTVSTYLLQAVVGMGITMIVALIVSDFFPAAGVLLPFGYGQGTGQALNYGSIYESQYGFTGGKSFGLTVAALGFLSAAIGGVIHLNVIKKQHRVDDTGTAGKMYLEQIQDENEISMNGSMDKLTVQMAIVLSAYFLTYLLMMVLGNILPGMKSVIYGFNFLIGVLMASLIKLVIKLLTKGGIVKRKYTNNFLMNRISNFFFDIMVVAGIAAINLELIKEYWEILLILGVVGLVITYYYNRFIARKLFSEYPEEQFLMMYGMLTGTASTGIILLREVDENFETPAADNLVYQNFPAIVFGFPMMLLATLAPQKPALTLIILAAFFIGMNVLLFRSFIFKKRKK